MTEHESGVQVFHAEPGWTFPELPGPALPPGARVNLTTDDAVWSVHDTVDGDLERFGASLARSATGQWRLRLDGQVHTAPAAGRGVPPEFRDLLLGVRVGAALRPVQRVATEWVTRVVASADDEVLGEIADISQQLLDTAEGAIELPHLVELIAVDGAFGDAVAKRLRKTGARRSGGPGERTKAAKPQTMAQALQAFLGAQYTVILQGDVGLRQGDDVVHPTRVAMRRIRSVLRIVDVFATDRAEALDADLRWMAGVLGDVRDLDVLSDHLAKSLKRLERGTDEDFPIVATREAVEAAIELRTNAAQESLRTAMRGRRYLALLRELRAWAADPPLADGADGPVSRLIDYARSARKKMKKRLAKANGVDSTHRGRRAAKRARYVAELVADAVPSERAKLTDQAKAAHRVQSSLGTKQDAAVAVDFLASLAEQPVRGSTPRGVPSKGLEPAAAFGIGVLWANERRRTA